MKEKTMSQTPPSDEQTVPNPQQTAFSSTSAGTHVKNVLRQAIAGGTASAFARTLEAPLERVKLILQNQQSMALTGTAPFKGVVDTLRRTAHDHGMLALWRGNLTNCTRIFPAHALRFTLFDYWQRLAMKIFHVNRSNELPLVGQLLSGALSGATTTLLLHPLDLARTHLSLNVSHTRLSLRDVMHNLYTQQGIRGIYRGVTMSVIEITPYTGISLGGFEFLKVAIVAKRTDLSPWQHSIALLSSGWLAGILGAYKLSCFSPLFFLLPPHRRQIKSHYSFRPLFHFR
jgi:hypothetical protein